MARRRSDARRVLGASSVLGLVVAAGMAAAQVAPSDGAPLVDPALELQGSAFLPEQQASLVTAAACPGEPPPAEPCERVTCMGGEWASTYKPVGTVCDDSNPCTYADKCTTAGGCVGTPISCGARGPCETSTCNDTSSCVVVTRAAGTACPYSNSGNLPEPPNPCENTCDGTSYRCQP